MQLISATTTPVFVSIKHNCLLMGTSQMSMQGQNSDISILVGTLGPEPDINTHTHKYKPFITCAFCQDFKNKPDRVLRILALVENSSSHAHDKNLWIHIMNVNLQSSF